MLNIPIKIGIATGVLFLIIFLLPPSFLFPYEVDFPTEIESSFQAVFSAIWSFDFLIPVATLLLAFLFSIIIDLIFFGIKLVIWIFNLYAKQN